MTHIHSFQEEPYRTLTLGIRNHNYVQVAETLKANPNLDLNISNGPKGLNILSFCICEGTPEILRLLVRNGMNPNPKTPVIDGYLGYLEKSAPLYLCILNDERGDPKAFSMFKALLELGADTERIALPYSHGLTPLARVLVNNRPDWAELLVNAGAVVDEGGMEQIIHKYRIIGILRYDATTPKQRKEILEDIRQRYRLRKLLKQAFLMSTVRRDGKAVARVGELLPELVHEITSKACPTNTSILRPAV